jgi:hypothetical protein
MGGVTPPLGLVATRHTAQAHADAGVTNQPTCLGHRRGARAPLHLLCSGLRWASLGAGRRVLSCRHARPVLGYALIKALHLTSIRTPRGRSNADRGPSNREGTTQ